MLFQSTLRKELARTFGAALVILITIVMTMMLIRTLGLASHGSVNPSDVFLVMLYTVVGYLPTILSLSLFAAIVGTLSRMYRDSEMAVWFASGCGLRDFVRPLFGFAWPVLLLVALFSLLAWPWANSQTIGMREQYERRSDLDRVAPGQFQQSAGGNRVFFIEKGPAGGTTASNVFISSIDHGKRTVTSAQNGRIETVGKTRYLMLSDGQRVESPLDKSGMTVSEFGTYGARMGDDDTPQDALPDRAKTTLALLQDPRAESRGELGWRVGMLFAAINFVLLGLLVSNSNPRAGRSGNLLFAMFAFVIYYNLLNLGQSWISSGRFGLGSFMLLLHGGVLTLGLLWLARRDNPRWQPRPRRIVPIHREPTA